MIPTKPTPPGVVLRGQRNVCPSCGELFSRTSGFTKHRTGSFSQDTRRCLTVEEMQECGFHRDVSGFWRFSKPGNTWRPWQQKSAVMAGIGHLADGCDAPCFAKKTAPSPVGAKGRGCADPGESSTRASARMSVTDG